MMLDMWWISLGAIVGANLRYWVSSMAAQHFTASLPYGTFIVNVTGSFIIGLFMAWTTERVLADPHWRLLIVVGFCGAYTTFSSYSYETITLLEHGSFSMAALNFVFNNLFCLLATIAGIALARAIS